MATEIQNGLVSTANDQYDYDRLHGEHDVEYSTVAFVIVSLISVGIFVIGLGIFIKYVMDSQVTMRRMSLSSQYSEQAGRSPNGGHDKGSLPTVPSGVMLIPPGEGDMV